MDAMECPLPRIAAQPAFHDRWALERLNDHRDLVFVHLMFQCALVACFGIALFFAGEYFWYLVPVYYLVLFGGVIDRYILMLHCTSHRQLFKAKHRVLNQIIPWVLGPFCGESPETYFGHHMGMHHVEENLAEDLSSTMKYRRDSFVDWLRYYLRFLLFVQVDIARYFVKRGRGKMMRRVLLGENLFIVSVAALAFINPWATLMVFALPFVIVRTLMMMGNWGQHAFVDARDPADPYLSSITCINSRYNRRCFNDGYHIYHHVKARHHWSELPGEFETNREEYGRRDAIVFEGLDFFMVWFLLMTKRYRRLARAFVQLPGAPERDEDQVIALMKSRLQPVAAI